MFINYIVLLWGGLEIIFGLRIYSRKGASIKNFLIDSYKAINKSINAQNLEDSNKLSKALGEIICMEGSLYVFLASTAIYSKMSWLIVIIFVVAIEIVIFRIINKTIEKFLK